ncbi:MAG: hypothetical protein J1F63_03770 [Oscillospiraceae bacterium]|nr:hypothetical protein [Oscillospiraceae bacterium]
MPDKRIEELTEKEKKSEREIEKLANEKFNGDIAAAIEYVYRDSGLATYKNEKMDKLYSELTKEELEIAYNVVMKIAEDKVGKKGVKSATKGAELAGSLNISPEEIAEAETNPFSSAIKVDIIALIAIAFVPILIEYALKDSEVMFSISKLLDMIQGIGITLMAIKCGTDLVSYFKFKRAKKLLAPLDDAQESE